MDRNSVITVSKAPGGSDRHRNRAVQVGILGAGFIADLHLRALRTNPQVEVAAVCDVKWERALALQRKWRIPHAFGGLNEMLAGAGLDVVHILVPPDMHATAAIACLEAGRAVFIEKPAAVSTAECRLIEAAARKHGALAGVNHNAVHHPAFLRLLEAVKQWRLGAVEHVMACVNVGLRQLARQQHDHWMFRQPANILLEQALHPLSQVFQLAGELRSVAALTSGRTELTNRAIFHKTWQISMVCERATAQCFLSFGRTYHDQWVRAIGEDAVAEADLRRNTVRLADTTRFLQPADDLAISLRGGFRLAADGLRNFRDYGLGFLGIRPAADPFFASMRNSIQAFYSALLRGQAPPTGLPEASVVIKACESIAAAADESVMDRERYA